jgi:CBS domain-containing protein
MTLTAADVMQTHLISVSPSDPLHAVKRLFFEEEIHGAPVVDDEGRVRGMITSMDLIRAATDGNEDGDIDFSGAVEELGLSWSGSGDDFQSRLGEAVVADVMSDSVVSVAPDTSVSEIAKTLRENRIHRVLVVKEDSLMGIVSSFDLIRVLENLGTADLGAQA